MPTNRRRKMRDRITGPEGLSEETYYFFSHGDFFEAEGYSDDKSEEELKSIWQKHRVVITQRYMEEKRQRNQPGERPWYWWKHEMLEPQRHVPQGHNALQQWDHQKSEFSFVESDYEYLKRLNLLATWEIQG